MQVKIEVLEMGRANKFYRDWEVGSFTGAPNGRTLSKVDFFQFFIQDYRDPNDEDRRCYWWSYSRNNVVSWSGCTIGDKKMTWETTSCIN